MPKVTEGLNTVKQMVDQADGRIIIMPASGLNSSNVATIISTTGVTEVHTSARIRVPSTSTYQNKNMQEDFDIDFVDVEEITRIKNLLSLVCN